MIRVISDILAIYHSVECGTYWQAVYHCDGLSGKDFKILADKNYVIYGGFHPCSLTSTKSQIVA